MYRTKFALCEYTQSFWTVTTDFLSDQTTKKNTQNHSGWGRFHFKIMKINSNKTHKMSGPFFLTCWKFNQSCCVFFSSLGLLFSFLFFFYFLLVHTNTSTPKLCISCVIVNVFGRLSWRFLDNYNLQITFTQFVYLDQRFDY